MRIVVQRVNEARVKVDSKIVGEINTGALVFFAVHKEDCESQISWLANKLINLRMFHDENEKMNKSLIDINGEVLVVSQFTLYADCMMGRRPSFTESCDPKIAEEYYNKFIQELKNQIKNVQSGIFAAKMQVELINNGPVTFIIDAKKL